ncbi:MAG: hypothetical protein D6753_01255 [Planctomycetota bacterium]|nr:MAG: hypothetical protein D6753_01255 [Planctomycetota bacterium]
MPAKPYGDGIEYEAIAFSLVESGEFRVDTSNVRWRQPYEQHPDVYAELLSRPTYNRLSTGRPPLVPAFIALIYLIVGRNQLGFAAVHIAFAVMIAVAQALSVAMVVWYGQRSSRSAAEIAPPMSCAVAVAAAVTLLLAGAHRTISDYATDFLTEPAALFLTQVFVLCGIETSRRSNAFYFSHADVEVRQPGAALAVRWLVPGIVAGLMILARSIFFVWLPGIALMVALAERRHRLRAVWAVAGLVCGAGCVCAPWWVRNCVVSKSFMPLGTQGAIALLGGYNDVARESGGEWQFAAELQLREEMSQRPAFRSASEEQREVMLARAAQQRVSRWIGKNWDELPAMFVRRVITHWNPYDAKTLGWRLLIVLGAIEVMRHGQGFRVWLLGLPVVSTLVVAGLYSVGGRFLVPCHGVLYVLAGLGGLFMARTALRLSHRRLVQA